MEAVGLTIESQSGRSEVDLVFNDGLCQFLNRHAPVLMNK